MSYAVNPQLLAEILHTVEAVRIGNSGRVRVCARRMVGFALESLADYNGINAMGILNRIATDTSLPADIRADASTLLQGIRDYAAEGFGNTTPVKTALRLISAIRPDILLCLQQSDEFKQLDHELSIKR
ncbi:MAG: hypothetical protein JNL32_13105 [Candidatus Kapabacteria bacterium]|nr:hypothetical protein [Candidatus Kapabacteria bacterium]